MSGTVRVTREALLPAPAERVWQVVTSLEDTAWRSDLREVNDLGEGRFVEVTKGGVSTTFATVVWEPGRRWAFTLENPSLTGRWEGVFQPREGGDVGALNRRGHAPEVVPAALCQGIFEKAAGPLPGGPGAGPGVSGFPACTFLRDVL